MKKVLVFALCVVGFILIAAPTAVEYAPLFINGKPAGQAVLINGVIAISVESFAKAGGATLTLQPYFQRQGPRLLATIGTDAIKYKDEAAVKLSPAAVGSVPAVQAGVLKQSPHPDIKFTTGVKNSTQFQIFRVQKGGEISGHVFEDGGKAYIPLADLATAFGGTFTAPAANVFKPGEAIRLNFSVNPNAILIGL
jgi:hypothetical protein